MGPGLRAPRVRQRKCVRQWKQGKKEQVDKRPKITGAGDRDQLLRSNPQRHANSPGEKLRGVRRCGSAELVTPSELTRPERGGGNYT